MSKQVYDVYSPFGGMNEGIENLQAFCDEYNNTVKDENKINYDSMRKACKAGKEYKGWIINKRNEEDSPIDCEKSIEKTSENMTGLNLEEKVLRLSDENSRLKSDLKKTLRTNGIFKDLADIINSKPDRTYVPELKYIKQSDKICESACLVLSDLHCDYAVDKERVNDLEQFDFNAFCHRAENLVKTTIKHLTENMKGYSFENLYIFALGDNIEGVINDSMPHTKWQNCFKSAEACGEVISKMVLDLSPYFKKITYVGISGNHTRLDPKKKIDFRGANLTFDWLIHTRVKKNCKALINEGRADFIIRDCWSVMLEIHGYNFHVSHGHTLPGTSQGIPHYALQRRSQRLTALGAVNGKVPHYQIIGHFHSMSMTKQTVGEIIINGAFPATNEFAMELLSAYNEPAQLLFGIHPKHGITWRMPVILRSKNWETEEKKPHRYNKDLF